MNPSAVVTSKDERLAHAGAADTVPVPVCVRNCFPDVMLPESFASTLEAEQ